MSRAFRLLTVLAIGLGAMHSAIWAAPSDWPEWRGPARDGKSPDTGLRKEWPESGPELVWKADGLGIGYSSVSLQNGRVYSMGEANGAEHVVALDLTDGKVVWKTVIGKNAGNGGHAGPRCTPTLDGEYLYAIGSNGDLACLKTADGEKVWAKNLKDDFGGKMMSGWGYSESPLIDGDKLVCTPGGPEAAMVALNKRTGEEIWRASLPDIGKAGKDGAGYSSIVISNAAGIKQYVQLLGRGVIGVQASDGKFLWGYNRTAGGVANVPTPIVQGDYVFSTTGYPDGGSAVVEIEKADDGSLKAQEVWYHSARKFQNHHGGMILIGEHLYGGHGQNKGFPTCLEFKTGKIIWGGPDNRGPGEGSAAVAYADGNLYFRYQNAVLALIAAKPAEYKTLSKFKLPDSGKPSWPHPVIAGGKLFIRDQDQLYCFDLQTK